MDGDVREVVEKMVLSVLGRPALAEEMSLLMGLAGERRLPAAAAEEGRARVTRATLEPAEPLAQRLGRVAHALFASVDFRYLK
jgi:hypothetical protein